MEDYCEKNPRRFKNSSWNIGDNSRVSPGMYSLEEISEEILGKVLEDRKKSEGIHVGNYEVNPSFFLDSAYKLYEVWIHF